MVQRSNFSSAKMRGASGVALGPCVLFSVLVGCLVGGLALLAGAYIFSGRLLGGLGGWRPRVSPRLPCFPGKPTPEQADKG